MRPLSLISPSAPKLHQFPLARSAPIHLKSPNLLISAFLVLLTISWSQTDDCVTSQHAWILATRPAQSYFKWIILSTSLTFKRCVSHHSFCCPLRSHLSHHSLRCFQFLYCLFCKGHIRYNGHYALINISILKW